MVFALLLIVAIGASTSTVAFAVYASSLNEVVTEAAQRAAQFATQARAQHHSLAQYAQQLVKASSRPRLHIFVVNDLHTIIAGRREVQGRVESALRVLLGIHNGVVHVPGGVIVVEPDLGGFKFFLRFFWTIILPVGVIAVLAAWLVGRNITRRAVEPLVEVTQALRKIADGDFTPQPLLHHSDELRDLTVAYDDVAYRLNAATAERLRNEAEMRQFIADAGHELRTPLTIIMGYLDALQQGVVQDAAGVARVRATMLGESRRMRTVIEKLIFLARLERQAGLRSDTIDLASLVQRAVDALAPLANDRLRYSGSGSGTMPLVGDADELHEAIKNVIENALKYSQDAPVQVALQTDVRGEQGTTVTVRDHGPGMDETDLAHAFDRFYRGSARIAAEGSGLGLAIAKRALERFGATIEIASTHEGTTVTLTFPQS